jgi:hypothetical protein
MPEFVGTLPNACRNTALKQRLHLGRQVRVTAERPLAAGVPGVDVLEGGIALSNFFVSLALQAKLQDTLMGLLHSVTNRSPSVCWSPDCGPASVSAKGDPMRVPSQRGRPSEAENFAESVGPELKATPAVSCRERI